MKNSSEEILDSLRAVIFYRWGVYIRCVRIYSSLHVVYDA